MLPGSGFEDTSNWETFDPNSHVGGQSGYSDVIRAGDHLYFIPFFEFSGANLSSVLRYQLSEGFSSPNAYEALDLQENGIANERGYGGAAFDGQYLYLAPAHNSDLYHGEVVRYDTENPFADSSSWSTFNPKENGVGSDPVGFEGNVVFDGQYVYFPPHGRNAEDGSELYDGEVLRYDTGSAFVDPASWSTFDPVRAETEDEFHGFFGSVYDERFVYFLPFNADNEGTIGGEFVRYDTEESFADPAAWTGFDPRDHGIGGEETAYTDATFDGRFIYLAPQQKTDFRKPWGSTALRYDTHGGFRDPNAWSDVTPASSEVGTDPRGYSGVVSTDEGVYFSPTARRFAPAGPHGEVLRYSRSGSFGDSGAWSTFDPGANGVGTDPGGYSIATATESHIYFAPLFSEIEFGQDFEIHWHSEILRFDTR